MAVGTGLEAGRGLGLQKRGDWGWNTAGLGGRLEHWQRCIRRLFLLLWPMSAAENLPGPSLFSQEEKEHFWSAQLRIGAGTCIASFHPHSCADFPAV